MNQSDVKHLFDYTEWANGLALSAAANLSEENLRRDFGISHGSIFGTLRHMAGAEWIWLERWHGHSPPKVEAWSLWTDEGGPDLAKLNERWRDIIERRASFRKWTSRGWRRSCRSNCSAAIPVHCRWWSKCNTSPIMPRSTADKWSG